MSEFYLTHLLRTSVFDRQGEEIGKIKDFSIIAGEPFPKVTGLEISPSIPLGNGSSEKTAAAKRPLKRVIPIFQVDLLSRNLASLTAPASETQWREPQGDEIFLARDLLDKQIVDTHGCKVVRVNDLKLARTGEDLILVAADVGITGLLRRLGLEPLVTALFNLFGKGFPPTLIPWNLVEPLETELSHVRLTIPHKKIAQLHPADIAEIIHNLPNKERAAIIEDLDHKTAAEAMEEVDLEVQLAILDNLDSEKAADIIEEMAPDDAADLLSELPEEKAKEILQSLSHEEAMDISGLLHYDEDTAGGLMTPECISLHQHLTAQETIEKLRELSPDAETIYYLYVVNEEERLVGVLSLRDLIVSPPNTPLSAIMQPKVVSVPTSATKETIARLIAKYDLLAIPVTDEEKRLEGIITVDDVVDLLYPHGWKKKAKKAF